MQRRIRLLGIILCVVGYAAASASAGWVLTSTNYESEQFYDSGQVYYYGGDLWARYLYSVSGSAPAVYTLAETKVNNAWGEELEHTQPCTRGNLTWEETYNWQGEGDPTPKNCQISMEGRHTIEVRSIDREELEDYAYGYTRGSGSVEIKVNSGGWTTVDSDSDAKNNALKIDNGQGYSSTNQSSGVSWVSLGAQHHLKISNLVDATCTASYNGVTQEHKYVFKVTLCRGSTQVIGDEEYAYAREAITFYKN
ncbi:MAG: hypothetical protein ABIH23_33075 [bacterium]